MFVLMLLTFSRGAWLGWFAGLVAILAVERRLSNIVRSAVRLGLVILILGVVAASSRPELLNAIAERFDSTQTELSDETHLEFAVLAVDMFTSRPIEGNGLGSYYQFTGISHPHNTYLQILAELGIVGLFLALLWTFQVLRHGYQALQADRDSSMERAIIVGLLGAFISILVNNIVQQSLYFNFTFLIAGLIGAVYHLMTARVDES